MKVQNWPIDRPLPYARNPRVIPDRAVDKVAASIQEFGFRQPIVVDQKDVIVVGHARLLAALKLGLAKVPVHVAEGLTPSQIRAYRLMDNRSGEDAKWDDELLPLELGELGNFDLELTGFDPGEINALVPPTGGHTGEDDAPEPSEILVSRTGDVWRCGAHRVLCGDATSEEDVDKVLDGAEPLLMVTDPPYGVEYDPDWRNHARESLGVTHTGTVQNDDRGDWREAWAVFSGDVAYVWHAGTKAGLVAESLAASGLLIRSQIIWAKQNFVISRGHYHVQHEPCWYAVRKGRGAGWAGGRKQSTIWNVANRAAMGGEKDDLDSNHGTQKPVEVMRRPILNHTKKGGEVYDPFLGSGTTMIAAESVGRICYGIEIDPVYVDVAVKRWQEFTGETATCEENGKGFDQVAKARRRKAA